MTETARRGDSVGAILAGEACPRKYFQPGKMNIRTLYGGALSREQWFSAVSAGARLCAELVPEKQVDVGAGHQYCRSPHDAGHATGNGSSRLPRII